MIRWGRGQIEIPYEADSDGPSVHAHAVRTFLVELTAYENLIVIVHQLDPEVVADGPPLLFLQMISPDRLPRDGLAVFGQRVVNHDVRPTGDDHGVKTCIPDQVRDDLTVKQKKPLKLSERNSNNPGARSPLKIAWMAGSLGLRLAVEPLYPFICSYYTDV